MKNEITILLPTPVAAAAINLLTMKNREVFFCMEEDNDDEDDLFIETDKLEQYNTEELKEYDRCFVCAEREDFESIIPMLNDWPVINEYPETYKIEHNL